MFCLVVVGGVDQITCETSVCILMIHDTSHLLANEAGKLSKEYLCF
jgi:hypothetical protein